MKTSVKYAMAKGVVRAMNMQKLMAMPYEKLKKQFKTGEKGPQIPQLSDPDFEFTTTQIKESKVLFIKHKEATDQVCIYLTGGGMLKYPKPQQAREVLKLAKISGRDMILPYYPLCDRHGLLDVYDMLYELYQETISVYDPDHILLLGGSSGANLALGLVSFIHSKNEGLRLPGMAYLSSPGTLLLTEEEKEMAEMLEKRDLIMSRKATETIQEGMEAGQDVPDFMKYLQLGNYRGLKEAYLCFGGDEVFAAAADSIKKRLEECGCNVTCEIGEGLYHCYSLMPFVKEAMPGYERMVEFISVNRYLPISACQTPLK